MHRRTILWAAAGFSALAGAAEAAEMAAATPAALDEVVVTADPLRRAGDEVVSHVAVIEGEALVRRREATLGETLSGVPGVSSDTFGGGASRPVVRGQTAPRVKALSDGAALLDASDVSPDHAVTTEPLLLEGIEILRGPSALLYGGGAIGGAVNLRDRKVPTAVPARGGEGVLEVRAGTADDEEAAVLGVTAGARGLALRLEGSARRTSDYDVPDWTYERLEGSYNHTWTAAIGASWIGPRGYLGAAYSEQHSRYGLPGHSHEYEDCHPHGSVLHCGGHDHGHEHDHGDEHEHEDGAGHPPPLVDLRSRRIDVRGELRDLGGWIERLRLRGGYTDYTHDELDDGAPQTTFSNEGYDVRLELQHRPFGRLRGVAGVQASLSDFAAVGEESFVPQSRTRTAAVFLLEEYTAGDFTFEAALRLERQRARAQGRPSADHDPVSTALAAIWRFAPGYSAALSVSRSQRAPAAQELYARGVHLATNTFEIGDPDLDVETAKAVELTLRRTGRGFTISASAYRYAYDGYIFARTLDRFEDFRLIRYSQADAVFTGVEGEVRGRLAPWLSAAVFGDYVRGKLRDGGGNLPRIPAARLGARADMEAGRWTGGLEYVRVFEQDRIAAFETATPGYDMLNASMSYILAVAGTETQVYLRATNLLDELALNHASFITRLAPLRGRSFLLGLRTSF